MPETIEHLVSTIIPVFQRPRMLKEAVESVLAQTYRPIEIIISDDGSTDETVEVGRAFERQHPEIIRYLWNQNRGAGPARESGRQIARGEYIQYLDSDDLLWPRKFDIQVRALTENPECGAAYGFIRFCLENGSLVDKPHKWSGRTLPFLFPWLLVDRWWNTDCPLFRRSVCDAVGSWLDLRYSQDYEYDGRIGALGTKLVHCKEFVCDQRHHEGNRQTGHGDWLSPPERVRFFTLMFQHAQSAGVSLDTPEMKHFSRWVFLNVRQCSQMGDDRASRSLFRLSVETAGGLMADLMIYKLLVSAVGWKKTAAFTEWIHNSMKRRTGKHTLKQSWMYST